MLLRYIIIIVMYSSSVFAIESLNEIPKECRSKAEGNKLVKYHSVRNGYFYDTSDEVQVGELGFIENNINGDKINDYIFVEENISKEKEFIFCSSLEKNNFQRNKINVDGEQSLVLAYYSNSNSFILKSSDTEHNYGYNAVLFYYSYDSKKKQFSLLKKQRDHTSYDPFGESYCTNIDYVKKDFKKLNAYNSSLGVLDSSGKNVDQSCKARATLVEGKILRKNGIYMFSPEKTGSSPLC